jgi:hypothetical protein
MILLKSAALKSRHDSRSLTELRPSLPMSGNLPSDRRYDIPVASQPPELVSIESRSVASMETAHADAEKFEPERIPDAQAMEKPTAVDD